MDNGWIKLSRGLKEWRWYKDAETLLVFINLLLSANHKDNEVGTITIKRGQLMTSVKSICEDTGLTTQVVRTRLERLERTGEITQKSTNRFTIVTICNYDYYQSAEYDEQQTDNKQKTNKKQTDNKQITTNNNDKNDKNDKNVNPLTPLNGKTDLPEYVDEAFAPVLTDWLAYKKEKKQTYKPTGLKACYNKLVKYSGGDPSVAREIIDHSMANNYSGFFELKTNKKNEDRRFQHITFAGTSQGGEVEATL